MDLGLATFGGGLLQTAGNIWSARRQEDFQERMSSTAYQRAAKDLEAAGLNRMLAVGSPATTPGGAVAQFPNIGEAYSAGASAKQNISESKTRETVNAATEQAQIATAKAAEEKGKLDAEVAARVRAMLPYEMTESGGRIKAAGQEYELGELKKRGARLDLSEKEFFKNIYDRLNPIMDKVLNMLSPYLSGAVDGGVPPGTLDKLIEGNPISNSALDFIFGTNPKAIFEWLKAPDKRNAPMSDEDKEYLNKLLEKYRRKK